MRNTAINFMSLRKYFLIVSVVLLIVSAASLALRGLQFGTDFRGGTSITITDGQGKTIEEVRDAFVKAEMPDPVVQTVKAGNAEGFIIKTSLSDETQAQTMAKKAAEGLGIENGYSVSIVGAGWGKQLTNSALLAFGLSVLAILIYIAFRFEYKMAITAVVALIHDLFITLGIYSLFGREVSPATIAALLTILGYSLYDTVVVFGRIKENTKSLTKSSFSTMANVSINEVFVRSINTTITTLIPVITMLVVNVDSLNGFAFALAIGLVIGVYSSIGVAAPLYALWKEREPRYAALRAKYGASGGVEYVADDLDAKEAKRSSTQSKKTASSKGAPSKKDANVYQNANKKPKKKKNKRK